MIDEPFCSSGMRSRRARRAGPSSSSAGRWRSSSATTATVLQRARGLDQPRRGRPAPRTGRGRRQIEPGVIAPARAHALGEPAACSARCRRPCRRAGAGRAGAASPAAARCPSRPGGAAAELLAERDRHGIHQVRAARLDHVAELAAPWRASESPAARARAAARCTSASSAARWIAVGTRRWRTGRFDVVVGVDAAVGVPRGCAITSLAFMLPTCPSRSGTRRRETGRRARPRRSRSRRRRSARLSRIQQPQLGVDARRGGLDPAQPVHDRDRDRLPRHREVLNRLAGLPAPKLCHLSLHRGLRRNLDDWLTGRPVRRLCLHKWCQAPFMHRQIRC